MAPAPSAHTFDPVTFPRDEEVHVPEIFCLVEADSAEDANTVHREAHGLVADEVYSVGEHSREKEA